MRKGSASSPNAHSSPRKYSRSDSGRTVPCAFGENNAETWEDFTHYWFRFPSDRWEKALEIEAEAIDDAELLEKQLTNDLAARARTRNEWRAMRGLPKLPGPEGEELIGNGPAQAGAGGAFGQQQPGQPGQDANGSGGHGGGILDRLMGPVNRLNGHNGNGHDDGGGGGSRRLGGTRGVPASS